MKRALITIVLSLFGTVVMFADDVAPATAEFDCKRNSTQGAISGTYYRGTTLLFTNCQAFSDAGGIVTQGLDGVTVTFQVGDTSASAGYTGTVSDATSGMFHCQITVPTNTSAAYVQVTLTDTNAVSYIYPWKTLSHKASL